MVKECVLYPGMKDVGLSFIYSKLYRYLCTALVALLKDALLPSRRVCLAALMQEVLGTPTTLGAPAPTFPNSEHGWTFTLEFL